MIVRWRLGVVLTLVSLLGLYGVSAKPRAALADPKADVDWKAFLSEAEITKLVAESVKVLQDATRSQANFNAKGLKDSLAENEGYVLMIYAEAGMKSGDETLAKRCGALHDAAAKLAQACKDKNLDDAKKQVATIAGFKTMKGEDVKAKPLNEAIPIKNLMKTVGKQEEALKQYRRLSAAAFGARGKADEVHLNALRMAALTGAITAHAPAKDEDAKKTRKFWLESTADTRDIIVELAGAARAKKLDAVKSNVTKMSDACTKCHDIYRVEVN